MNKALMVVLAVLIISGCGGGGSEESNTSGNRAPSAYVGDDRTVAVGSTVALDGSQCSDSDGDTLTFAWRFVSRPQGSAGTLSDTTATHPTFVADQAGTYIIELVVSDSNATAADSIIITAAAGQTGTACSQIVAGANVADDFVCAHNAVRANAQPAPIPSLPEMTWDPALAQIAREHAQKCAWGHNPNPGATYPDSVGENIFASYGMVTTPETPVQYWADEARDYDYDTNTCQGGKVCGHYTQIVWRESVKVGCARAFCSTLSGLGYTDADYYVCNYAPAGNYYGEQPY